MRNLLAFCLLTLSSLPSIAQLKFGPRQDVATGLQQLHGLVAADFNGDGKLDLAVTSSLDKQVLVYLNHGDGTFGAPIPTTLQIPNTTGSIVAGDFNEDGKQDLIVATIAGPQQDIFLSGNGDGTFTQRAALPGSFGFVSAAVVDINHDGHLDLIEGGNGPLYSFLGDGHGNFTLQPFTNQGPSGLFLGLAAGDFNNDHRIDFVTSAYGFGNSANAPGSIRFYSGNDNGTFRDPSLVTGNLIQSPAQFAAADFDGDGNLDILFSEPNVAVILFGNGDGTFKTGASQTSGLITAPSTGPQFSIDPPLIATADMDGDGKPDGVTADNTNNTLYVSINDGTGQFPSTAAFSAPLDNGSGALQLADLNGDGLPDLIVTNFKTQKISFFLSMRPQTAPNVNVSSSASQALVGTPLIFTAKVGGIPTRIATGSVTLLEGSTTIAQKTLDSTGQATFAISTFSVGPHSLTLNYSGDQSYLAASSTAFTQSITDFQATLPTTTQTVTAGSTASYMVALAPVGSLAGTATLSCSGLLSGYSCPSTTVVLSGQPINGTISVITPAHTQAQVAQALNRSVYAACLGLPSLLLASVLLRRRSLLLKSLPTLCIITFAVASVVGCSGNSNASKTPPIPTPVTTNFTITASVTQAGQTVTHSTAATLTVN